MADQKGTDQVVGLVYCKPHIRRFLLLKLCPVAGNHTPNGHATAIYIASVIGLRVQHMVPPEELERTMQALPLRMVLPEFPIVDPVASAQVNIYAEKLYRDEFHAMVDNLTRRQELPMDKLSAIRYFRGIYGITEDDLQLDASIRDYHRYEQSKGRQLKKGGARMKQGRSITTGRFVGQRARVRARRNNPDKP